jgi:hypothetical protein
MLSWLSLTSSMKDITVAAAWPVSKARIGGARPIAGLNNRAIKYHIKRIFNLLTKLNVRLAFAQTDVLPGWMVNIHFSSLRKGASLTFLKCS